jgi:hypothetical protein
MDNISRNSKYRPSEGKRYKDIFWEEGGEKGGGGIVEKTCKDCGSNNKAEEIMCWGGR